MIKVKFVGVWGTFKPKECFLYKLLERNGHEVQVVNKDEDIRYISCFGGRSANAKAKLNVFYTGESDYNAPVGTDVSVGFLPSDAKHIQLRNYERWCYEQFNSFDTYAKLGKIQYDPDKEFCLFSVSNARSSPRIEFFDYLNDYKPVVSIGNVRKNTKDKIPRLDYQKYMDYVNKFNFMITFENKQKRYYITEKIYNGMRGGAIPIYWGDVTEAQSIFNEESFIPIENKDWDRAKHVIRAIEKGDLDLNGVPYVNEPEKLDQAVKDSLDRLLAMMVK